MSNSLAQHFQLAHECRDRAQVLDAAVRKSEGIESTLQMLAALLGDVVDGYREFQLWCAGLEKKWANDRGSFDAAARDHIRSIEDDWFATVRKAKGLIGVAGRLGFECGGAALSLLAIYDELISIAFMDQGRDLPPLLDEALGEALRDYPSNIA